jgi:CRISPR-associated protein Csh1
MIISIKEIGKEIAKRRRGSFLKLLTGGEEKIRNVKEPLLMRVIFSFDDKKIIGDVVQADKDRLQEYCWIGNTEGAYKNRLTTDRLNYLVSEEKKERASYGIIRNIVEFLEKKEVPKTIMELKNKLERIENMFFGNPRRARKSCEEAEKIPHKDKAILFTACIKENEKIEELAKTDGYEKFLEYIFLRPHRAVRGYCYICGKVGDVLPDPAFPRGTILKIYVVDKKGFTSGVADTDEARIRTFSVCQNCLRELLIGERYIRTNLRDWLGQDLNVYLIPKGVRLERLDKMARHIRGVFGAVKGFEGLQKFERKLNEEAFHKLHEKFTNENVCLDLIFGGSAGSHFDLKYHIQDVPILRLKELEDEMREVAEEACKLLGGSEKDWSLGFQEIREIFPMRVRHRGGHREEVYEWKALLELFSAMINKTPYPRQLILKRAIMLARIHRFGVYELYGMQEPKEPDEQLVMGVLKYNFLLKLLSKIGCLDAGGYGSMSWGWPINSGQYWDYWREMEYNDKEKALFLLGYIVGKIGMEQSKKGDERKAILNKINFSGMSLERIEMLANSVLKSLRDYRILTKNEATYAMMKVLLDKTRKELKNPIENLFNILSGYAFITYVEGKNR